MMQKNVQAPSEPVQETAPQNSQEWSAGFVFEGLELSIEEMLRRGVHFGHKKSRWNPKMAPYTFTVKNDIHIIDLEKTKEMLEAALEFAAGVVKNGGKIIFVGTKPQAKKLVEEAARSADMPYVSNRWLGGTFTNFPEIKKRIKYLNSQESSFERNEMGKYTKYEQAQFKKEIERMNEKMGGIKKMENLPQAMFALDVKEDHLAVKEAGKMKIPVIAVVDTNTDPSGIDFPIPGNDDALSSLAYIAGLMAQRVKKAKQESKASLEEARNKKNSNQANPL
jgi:small subunit ribosomal protein S2